MDEEKRHIDWMFNQLCDSLNDLDAKLKAELRLINVYLKIVYVLIGICLYLFLMTVMFLYSSF
jgi:hypothetical protein